MNSNPRSQRNEVGAINGKDSERLPSHFRPGELTPRTAGVV